MKKGNIKALLPIAVYLVLFLGSGLITKDFYAMPAIVAFLIALLVAMIQTKGKTFDEKINIISKSVGEPNIITMCLIFLCSGAFSGLVSATGGAESAVNLGLSVLPSQFAVVGLFVIGCFISISMGTSMGTIAALAPIAVGIAENTGFSLALCMGAVMCGAMFGDNLSMISDTTIAAVKTQGCEMKDKFKENFFIVLPAAILSIVVFYVLTSQGSYVSSGELSYNILKVVPYIFVLVGALIGLNVFTVLISGTALSFVIGLLTKSATMPEMFSAIGSGVTGMYDITVISIIVACVVGLMKENGGIDYLLHQIKNRIHSKRGAQFGIASLAFLVDLFTANNTVAIIMAGPIAKEMSDEFDVNPKRTASLLDIFASVGQGFIPYGAQLLSAASLTGLTPLNIMPFLYYPLFMAISAFLFIMFRKD